MMRVLRQRPEATERSFVDSQAGIAIGCYYEPSFLSPGEEGAPGWLSEHDLVAAIDGQVLRAGGVDLKAGDSILNPHGSAVADAFRRAPQRFPEGLEGVFNLILWDSGRRILTVASDPLGCKPFYLYQHPARSLFIFASELRAILAHPAVTPEPEMQVVALYLARGSILPPFSIQKGASRLAPGETTSVDAAGNLTRRRYWRASPAQKHNGDFDYWRNETRDQLIHSVSRLTRGTPRVAVFHSGGVDSSAALAALKLGGETEGHSFTLGYKGRTQSEDEMHWAGVIANEIGVPHHEILAESNDLLPDLVLSVIGRFDEPTNSSRAVSYFLLNEAARKAGFDSALIGTESEALFGTTSWARQLDAGGDPNQGSEERLRQSYAKPTFFKLRELNKLLADGSGAEHLPLKVYDSLREIIPFDSYYDCYHALSFVRGPSGGGTALDKYVLSSLSGVDTRSAFRELELFEFARSMPNTFKGSEVAEMRRATLIAAFNDICPSITAVGKKLALPAAPWINPEFPDVRDLVLRSIDRLKLTGLVNPRRIDSLIGKFHDRVPTQGYEASVVGKIWLLFSLQLWFDIYVLGRDPRADLLD